MAIAHIAVLSAALSALLILPCAATIILTGGTADLRRLLTRHGRSELRAQNHHEHAGARHLARRHHRRVDRGPRGRDDRAYRRLDRSLRDPASRLAILRPPTIEQIAYDLRRLDHQRRTGPAVHSEVCLAAVMKAYDARLQLACRCLGITEFLDGLEGVERDIERVRVEGLLEAAGLVLRHEPGPAV
ncbi:hypothetical protein QLQ12_18120 [Actinoplanes sp. NEAU-A12]|uniref:Uncharacterized protein n=1 Tax=Actinoplanes sandaracinus TaxID=3045177 RepID=A0ABT6WLB9_9ACTN|nr:hypothetical protein [Actinoplanes sandaracinus]MDI6100530.1 hypothetical protein [Actinoplanes sandaracinus]